MEDTSEIAIDTNIEITEIEGKVNCKLTEYLFIFSNMHAKVRTLNSVNLALVNFSGLL